MRDNLGHPIDTAQLETAAAASVSCIRVHISEIGEIDAPGTWGQCKYYAYRGTSKGRTIGKGKGNAHRMDIDRPPSFRRHEGPKFSVGT